ncbi:hypothetical protein Ddye_024181 [Dipteronia dyeriana]|uniref:Uncharacterized protein n=1 Tax=Dipteronia dyeriana TaxID=168575 RepID=A0AAD9TV16_9ROSI|nr:hypothetical protein Ddye_024181 [Dipteronia dyeriana]
MDAYITILRKRQRAYPIVYSQRINILGTQFFVSVCCQDVGVEGLAVQVDYGRPSDRTGSYSLQHRTPVLACGQRGLDCRDDTYPRPLQIGGPRQHKETPGTATQVVSPLHVVLVWVSQCRPPGREKFKRENRAFGVSLLSKKTLS